MIETIDNILPAEINKKIIYFLLNEKWNFATDNFNRDSVNKENINKNKFFNAEIDMGLTIISYHKERNITLQSPLTLYAEIIYSLVKQKTKYKFIEPLRFYWNWYHPNSNTFYHKDEENRNLISFVYNLHTNDGGTIFKNNDLFIPSKDGQVLLFPSDLEHRGIAPKKSACRFNLNCVAIVDNS
jgi:DNA gyrase/topoisomerase IV subunit B